LHAILSLLNKILSRRLVFQAEGGAPESEMLNIGHTMPTDMNFELNALSHKRALMINDDIAIKQET
jgi:hypothetical protein